MSGSSDAIVLRSFDAIDDLAKRASESALTDEDRELGSGHPLVILVEATLESMSLPYMGTSLAGLNRATLEDLRELRLQLEHDNTKVPLQLLMYAFEENCDALTGAGYGDVADEVVADFFESSFPGWLSEVHAWAESEGLAAVSQRVSAASTTYESLSDGWWST